MRTEEPLLSTGAVVSAAGALIALVVSFWPDLLDETQQKSLLAVVAIAAPLIVAAVARRKVTPNSAVAERVDGDHVIAGEANDRVPEGDVVREVDSPRRAFPEGSPTS